MPEKTLDLIGLKCPLPALRTRKALIAAKAGDILIVHCSDPMATIDIPHLVQETGNILEAQSREDTRLIFRILKT